SLTHLLVNCLSFNKSLALSSLGTPHTHTNTHTYTRTNKYIRRLIHIYTQRHVPMTEPNHGARGRHAKSKLGSLHKVRGRPRSWPGVTGTRSARVGLYECVCKREYFGGLIEDVNSLSLCVCVCACVCGTAGKGEREEV